MCFDLINSASENLTKMFHKVNISVCSYAHVCVCVCTSLFTASFPTAKYGGWSKCPHTGEK